MLVYRSITDSNICQKFTCVYGYRDKNFFDRMIIRLNMMLSMLDTPVDFIDVDDVVYAHLLLEKRLRNGPSDDAAGESFNIAPYEALRWSEFARYANEEAKQFGRHVGHFDIPIRALYPLILFVDLCAFLLPVDVKKIFGQDVGIMTLSMILTAASQPIYDDESRNEKAKRVLGFDNLMRIEDSMNRVFREYQQNRIRFDVDKA